MTHPIPVIAWVVIAVVICLFLGLNLSLWSAYKNKSKKPAKPGNQIKNTIQDPWRVEDQQWKELSDRVDEYKKSRS